MNMTLGRSHSLRALLWAFILGAAGFVAGFMGPIALNPEANQGPLLGIFITGPGGALLGLLLYAVCGGLRASDTRQWQILGSACAVLIVATLYFCLPEPALRGTLIDAQVESCGPPAQRVDSAIAYWNKRVAEVTWAAPRPDWQADARQLSQHDEGAVVDVAVNRRIRIYEARKPWNKGRITASGWQSFNERKSYYVPYPGSCADYTPGAKSVYFNDYDLSGLNNGPEDWPPGKLSDFLDLQILESVPDEYRRFIKD